MLRLTCAFLLLVFFAGNSFAETINLHCRTEKITAFGEKQRNSSIPVFIARIELAEGKVYWGIDESYPHEITQEKEYAIHFNRDCLPKFKGGMCWRSGGAIN